ncbi:uncharacterized protein ACBR49_003693 [Aulostomus maculatus]
MKVPHRCKLAAALLLLVCEVIISQLCKSFITLVDGFHTLFILMHMTLPHSANRDRSQLPSQDSPPHPSALSPSLPSIPGAELYAKRLTGQRIATNQSSILFEASSSQLQCEEVNSHELSSSSFYPPALVCGLSYTDSRAQAMGTFFSALLLASLCISSLMEIVSFPLEPHPVQYPLLLVVVGVVSLLHNLLVLWLNWDKLRSFSEEETNGPTEPGPVLDEVNPVHSAMEGTLLNGALVLCNPATSSILDTDSQTPGEEQEVHQHPAAPQDSHYEEGTVKDLQTCRHGVSSKEHLESQAAPKTSVVWESSHHTESPAVSNHWPICLPAFILVIQGLLTSVLVLISSLVILMIGPQCIHSSMPCSLLAYLDPGVSTLAVVMLIARATPLVHKYGLLLMQATPRQICVSELRQRITSVPGVLAVHDLHIWELTDSFIVASVHVHSHAGFPVHRCTDMLAGITKVLKSAGVTCCTIQPEFTEGSASIQGEASPVNHSEGPSLPPVLTCSFACGNSCAVKMCCSPAEDCVPAGTSS